ncbi:GyrI-like domain-containing protein [Companilactobacillus metriopterae]|uniref:GyrI-like domain-containing protein n=1 Tax=Companilactobacillus metriopterae TaxID=1909267 RepID=UPI00100B7807|nr:effector binding domain-containing protein [Companilactobacillus metriopterae]
MSFEIKTLHRKLISGLATVLPAATNPDELPAVSEVKDEYIKKLADSKEDYKVDSCENKFYGINFNTDKPNYLVGVRTETEIADLSSFEIPAGDYAEFTTDKKSRLELDQFIGGAYAEIMSSNDYNINGNFNIEIIDCLVENNDKEFKVLIPITNK